MTAAHAAAFTVLAAFAALGWAVSREVRMGAALTAISTDD